MKSVVKGRVSLPASTGTRQNTVDGTLRIFLAEALLLPTGLITAAFLTRHLGAEGYGLFTLAATLVTWIEWTIASVFARATIKFVGEAQDWKPVGATVVRLHLLASIAAALLLWFLSVPIGRALGAPALPRYLALFAWDIPLFSLAQAHRNILVGLGDYRQRAFGTSIRWIVRLVLILLLVQYGLSVTGAILGCIGASLAELVICRWFIRPSFLGRSSFEARQLCSYALPLFLFAMTMRLYDKADLFMLKALGGTTAQAGLYGAAQNLAIIPGIFALSFSPVLLSSLSRVLRAGDHKQVQAMGRNALRITTALLPLAGLMAGAAPEIVGWLYGARFLPAASWMAWLIFGSVAIAMLSTVTAILTATGKPGWTLALAGPLLPVVIVCHFLLIPRLGALGAAIGTTIVAMLGALAAVAALSRLEAIRPPLATLWRSLAITSGTFLLAARWHAPGWLLFVKFPALLLFILIAFVLLGEFNDIPWGWREIIVRLRIRRTEPENA